MGGLREGDTMESMYERMEAVGVLEGLEFGGFERYVPFSSAYFCFFLLWRVGRWRVEGGKR